MGVLDCFSLTGKVALVTGGAGLYGRQIVTGLAEGHAKVFIAGRRLRPLQDFANELCSGGHDVTALSFDQGDEDSVLALRQEIMNRVGQANILVNNAVARPMKKGYEDDLSAFSESMRINATGLFAVTRAFGDLMAKAGGGSIIHIGSIQGMVGPDETIYKGTSMHGWYPDYFFHKGGMINFTRFVASYYGHRNVRCNCISPGSFWTEKPPEGFAQRYCERTFLGRLANETDLQGIVVFLASDASAYITGTNIPVDGGYTAK